MKIRIAGAGAGKTTKIANSIIDCYKECDSDKIIFCIAYTNNAAKCIENRIRSDYGYLPKRIHISTIHSFLYQELIIPYYYLLFGIHFDRISTNKVEPQKKNNEFKKLENKRTLHIEAISQRAKWVFVEKSKDKKDVKRKREVIQQTFRSYCGGIFLDEAQDIDQYVLEILIKFQQIGLNVYVMGDPKQDLKGYGCLRKLTEQFSNSVKHIVDCYRCPQCHLDLSNTLITDEEQQVSHSEIRGSLDYVYERDVSIPKYISDNHFGLVYISLKNERFRTHESDYNKKELLFREIEEVFFEKNPNTNRKRLSCMAYCCAEKMYAELQNGVKLEDILNDFKKKPPFPNRYIPPENLQEYLKKVCSIQTDAGLLVSSIDAIKGMEHNRCLFILSPDLAQYLVGSKKDDNKTKHKLYVALTRSTDYLCILITEETEDKFTRNTIDGFMERFVTN